MASTPGVTIKWVRGGREIVNNSVVGGRAGGRYLLQESSSYEVTSLLTITAAADTDSGAYKVAAMNHAISSLLHKKEIQTSLVP